MFLDRLLQRFPVEAMHDAPPNRRLPGDFETSGKLCRDEAPNGDVAVISERLGSTQSDGIMIVLAWNPMTNHLKSS